VGWATLAVVGLGSVAFHATMRFTMELCDEIPMLLLVLAFLVGKEDCIGGMSGLTGACRTAQTSTPQPKTPTAARVHVSRAAGRRRFRLTASALVAASAAVYVYFKVYEIFIVSFTLGVLVEIGIDLACKPKTWQTKACFWLAVLGIGSGKLIWEAEQRLGESVQGAWVLHVVWHFLSCIGGFFAIMHNFYLRQEKLGAGQKKRP
jgi:dihydroceramidase